MQYTQGTERHVANDEPRLCKKKKKERKIERKNTGSSKASHREALQITHLDLFHHAPVTGRREKKKNSNASLITRGINFKGAPRWSTSVNYGDEWGFKKENAINDPWMCVREERVCLCVCVCVYVWGRDLRCLDFLGTKSSSHFVQQLWSFFFFFFFTFTSTKNAAACRVCYQTFIYLFLFFLFAFCSLFHQQGKKNAAADPT